MKTITIILTLLLTTTLFSQDELYNDFKASINNLGTENTIEQELFKVWFDGYVKGYLADSTDTWYSGYYQGLLDQEQINPDPVQVKYIQLQYIQDFDHAIDLKGNVYGKNNLPYNEVLILIPNLMKIYVIH